MNKSSFKVSDLGEKELINRIITKTKECSNFNCNSDSINDLNSDLSLDLNSDFNSNFSSDFNFKSSSNFRFNSSFNSFNSTLINNFNFKTSIGDDCALINHNLNENSYLVASCDMLIQSTHFPDAMTYFQMGYKSVVVNVSDLAAMGAKPIGLLLSLAIPNNLLLDDFDEFICGVISACNDYQIPLIGGDTNESKEIIVSATAIGECNKTKSLMKYGFNKGDLVAITGEIGLAALGFELLSDSEKLKTAREIDSSFADLAIFKALKPKACQYESFILAKYNNKKNYKSSKSFHSASKFNISCTDITDGLASELYEFLVRDKQYNLYDSDKNKTFQYSKGILLYEDALPIEDEFKEIADRIGVDYLDLFFHIGEDFELLFTIPKDLVDILKEELDFFVIGEIVEVDKDLSLYNDSYSSNDDNFTLEMLLSNGEKTFISSKGYQHLTE